MITKKKRRKKRCVKEIPYFLGDNDLKEENVSKLINESSRNFRTKKKLTQNFHSLIFEDRFQLKKSDFDVDLDVLKPLGSPLDKRLLVSFNFDLKELNPFLNRLLLLS